MDIVDSTARWILMLVIFINSLSILLHHGQLVIAYNIYTVYDGAYFVLTAHAACT